MSRKIPPKIAFPNGFHLYVNLGSKLLNICLLFFLLLSLVSWQILSMPDTDQDGVINIDDLDDDNDGIPDAVEQYCQNANLANSTSGAGSYQDYIYWFNWTDAAFSDGLQDGDSQTFHLSDGTQITATISQVVNLQNNGGDGYVADDMNTWSGARLHQLYNTSGSAEVFHSGGATLDNVSFDISFQATKNGRTVYPDYVFIDGESTNGKGEYINAVANQGYWKVLEHWGAGASYTGLGTQTLNITDTESGATGTSVFYIEDATQFSIEIENHGGQAVGFGIFLECDSDGDGIYNQLDLDSDNDGIADILEAGGADTNGDGLGDQLTDTDGDGLADIFETAAGNTSSLFDADGNGINEISGDLDGDGQFNWSDLDSDDDGILDIVEVGGNDFVNDGQIDSHTTDTDADGFADAVDGDVGNDGTAENSSNAMLLSSADINSDGKPDSGYSTADTDGDGKANFLDIDVDGDGIVDHTEAQATTMFSLPSGSDSDGDGIDNNYDNFSGFGGNGVVVEDTDGDLVPDYQDTDADEDLILDQIEGHDPDGDHIAD
ncbi:MAG: CshA/CshB family fibrillar adhesin-related protein, partial [Bacteroidota bacterium]